VGERPPSVLVYAVSPIFCGPVFVSGLVARDSGGCRARRLLHAPGLRLRLEAALWTWGGGHLANGLLKQSSLNLTAKPNTTSSGVATAKDSAHIAIHGEQAECAVVVDGMGLSILPTNPAVDPAVHVAARS